MQALLGFLRRDLGEKGPANLAVRRIGGATGVKLPLAPVCGLSQLTAAPSLWGSSAVASAATARRLSSASSPRASSGEGLRIEPVTSEASATKLSPRGVDGMAIEQAPCAAAASSAASNLAARQDV